MEKIEEFFSNPFAVAYLDSLVIAGKETNFIRPRFPFDQDGKFIKDRKKTIGTSTYKKSGTWLCEECDTVLGGICEGFEYYCMNCGKDYANYEEIMKEVTIPAFTNDNGMTYNHHFFIDSKWKGIYYLKPNSIEFISKNEFYHTLLRNIREYIPLEEADNCQIIDHEVIRVEFLPIKPDIDKDFPLGPLLEKRQLIEWQDIREGRLKPNGTIIFGTTTAPVPFPLPIHYKKPSN